MMPSRSRGVQKGAEGIKEQGGVVDMWNVTLYGVWIATTMTKQDDVKGVG